FLNCHSSPTRRSSDLKHSSVILDFSISAHRGYSFRVFEALKYKKKLITTNPHIIRAEFYHPHNIYLLDQGTAGIPEFLRKPYVRSEEHTSELQSRENL